MVIIGYGFIGLGAIDFLLSLMGVVDITGFSQSPMIFGGIGAILIYLEIQKGKVAEFEGSLDEGETLLKSGNVTFKESLFNKKQESGVLLLTDRRLFYHGTGKITAGKLRISSDVGSNDFELLLGDISSVEITKFPSYIIIKDKDNNELSPNKFSIGMREKKEWKNEILKAVSGTD